MKKIVFALFIGLVLLSGCNSTKKVAGQQKPEPQKLEEEKPIVWKQELYPKLSVGDPITFLNSSEIILSGDFSNRTFYLQDGVIYRLDTIQIVTKTVPARTNGVLVSFKKASNGQIGDMNVSFSQNDETYQFNFKLKSDGTFTLNGNARLFFQGKEYEAKASVKGPDPKTAECLLLVNFQVKTETQPVNENAEGQTVSGTKVIK